MSKYEVEQKKRDRKMTNVIIAILKKDKTSLVVALSKLSDWHSVNEVKRIFEEVSKLLRLYQL